MTSKTTPKAGQVTGEPAPGVMAPEPVPPVVETAPTVASHPCDVCPARSTAQDSRLDYCEGCPSIERLCPSCQAYRPQVGWWWGTRFGPVQWVCSDCRYAPPDAAVLAKYPEQAAHPAFAGIVAAHPRFTVALEVAGEARFQAAGALLAHGGVQTGPVLERMAAQLRDPGYTGVVDVDCSDVDMATRVHASTVLHNAAYGMKTPDAASRPLARLMGAWERWVDEQIPSESPPPSRAEREAADRDRRRRGRERPGGMKRPDRPDPWEDLKAAYAKAAKRQAG